MRYSELLFEYNQQKLAATFGEKIVDRIKRDLTWPGHKRQYSANSFREYALQDFFMDIEKPLKKRNILQIISPYMKWIVHRYVTNKINFFEDIITKAIPTLLKYDALKRKKKLEPEDRDINKFDSLSTLMDAMDEYEDVKSKSEEHKDIEQKFYEDDEAELIHNDEVVKVVKLHTYEASCYFGKNTRWCTAATDDPEEAEEVFAEYYSAGPIYVILFKKTNERYQLHFASKQFMDEKDNPVQEHKLIEKYPKLLDIFTPIAEQNHSLFLNRHPSEKTLIRLINEDPRNATFILQGVQGYNYRVGMADKLTKANVTEKVQITAVTSNPNTIRYIENPSDKVQKAALYKSPSSIRFIRNPSEEIKEYAVKQDPQAIRSIRSPSDHLIQLAVKEHPNLIEYLSKYKLSDAIKLTAVQTNGYTIEHIKNPSEELQLIAVNTSPLAIDHLPGASEKVQEAAIRRDPRAFWYISYPTERIAKLALKLAPHSRQVQGKIEFLRKHKGFNI